FWISRISLFSPTRRSSDLIPPDGRGLRDQLEQRPQPAAGAVHGLVLQRFGDRVQERQRRGLLDVAEDDRADRADRHQQPDAQLADRKSTRLNSSHVKTSYA